MAKPGKRHKVLGFHGTGKGVYLTNEMRESIAYLTLTSTEKLVLVDFVRMFRRASSGDTRDIRDIGFTFTMAHMLELIDHKTFYRAREKICQLGFFKRADSLKQIKACAPDVFIPSTDWKKFKPDPATEQSIRKKKEQQKTYLKRNEERKRKFIQKGNGNKNE